jgi:eukaryotic-like serine/threonine-protein kinase
MGFPEEPARCPRCSAALSADQCDGLCPACIAKGVLAWAEPQIEPVTETRIRYETHSLIGFGGMGAVYEGFDRQLARPVALKFLHAHLTRNPGARTRFQLEILICSHLEHPGVIPIYDSGHDDEGRPFYVMRKVQGVVLSDVLRKAGCRPPEYELKDLLRVFNGLCATVSYAHSKRIIHRDLKPGNVMLSEFGEVFVLDWGLAKSLGQLPAAQGLIEDEGFYSETTSYEHQRIARMDDLRSETEPHSVLGSLGFMAPEQADGNIHEADERTDIYALGAILYNMLTLRPPVVGEERQLVLHKTAAGKIVPALEFNPRNWFSPDRGLPHCPKGRIPSALAKIAMKALSKNPRERFQSVEDLRRTVADATKA